MIRFETQAELDLFRRWLVDVLLAAGESSASDDVLLRVSEQANAYNQGATCNLQL